MIGKQVLAFGKNEKSEFINIGIFAASSGGRKGRCHIGRFTSDRERSHVWISYNIEYRTVINFLKGKFKSFHLAMGYIFFIINDEIRIWRKK